MDTTAIEDTQTPGTTNDETLSEALATATDEPSEPKAEEATDEPKPEGDAAEAKPDEPAKEEPERLQLDLEGSDDDGLGAAPPSSDPAASKKWELLKSKQREAKQKAAEAERRAAEAEAKLAALTAPKTIAAGKEPELSDPEIDYDAARFKQEWTAWRKRKDAEDASQAEQKKAQEQAAAEWNDSLRRYEDKRKALPERLFLDAREQVMQVLSIDQQNLLIGACDDAAKMVVALSQNPKSLERLKSIKNPAKFIAEAARLEVGMVTKNPGKKAPPPPERKLSSGAESNANATLDRLYKKAEETGVWTEYFKYKDQIEAKKAK